MARPLTLLVIFFLSMNLFSGLLISTGTASVIGVETEVGGDDKVNESTNQADDVSSGAPTGSTLFGMYNVLANGLSTLALPVTAGPTMLNRAGVPGAITGGVLQPIILIVYALGVISFLRGWGLI